MSIHFKKDGAWVEAERPYIKANGVWTPVKEAWVKRSGVWTKAYEYDKTPPASPVLTLEVAENKSGGKIVGRWVRVSVRLPGASHDTTLKRIRVLSDWKGDYPATQYGGTYISGADDNYPNEPWSDFFYNDQDTSGHRTNHSDSSVNQTKQWPLNASGRYFLAGNRHYHFSAWAEDINGNWSYPVQSRIWVPRAGADSENINVREARFLPTTSGSWTGGAYQAGQLIQRGSPQSRGVFLYGAQFLDTLGPNVLDIRQMQIRIHRTNDSGSATANVYIYRHNYRYASQLIGSPSLSSEVISLGTINKGESKWFAIPKAYYANVKDDQISGFGLFFRHPDKASAFANDYTVMSGLAENYRCGEVHMVWTEP